MLETGIITKLIKNEELVARRRRMNREKIPHFTKPKEQILSLKELQGAFYILAIGLFTSFSSFIFEAYLCRNGKNVHRK